MAVAAAELEQTLNPEMLIPENRYVSADQIPEIAEARQQVRQEAWALVHKREDQIAAGHEADIPLSLDALSTADAAVEARKLGINSWQYQEKLAGITQDCQRLTAEWFRKLLPEYFPKARHYFDAEANDFYSHGLYIGQMTNNALRPIRGNHEEVGRRVNERVEHETPLIIKKIGGFVLNQADVRTRTVSECTDRAIADYQRDSKLGIHTGYDGYVPEIEKVMIRDTWLEEETGDRLQEQIGLRGTYINHYVIQKAIRRRGVETGHMDKTELHGTQLLASDDLIDFVQLLDEVASEEWLTNIFMGEAVPADHPKDYSRIREEAIRRQEGQREIVGKVVTFVMDLAEDGYDRRKAPAKIENFVKLVLLETAKQDVSLAPQMFDEKTTIGLQQVRFLEDSGQSHEAFLLFQQVVEAAPGGGYCSGGSCGLESVNTSTKEGQELSEKVKAEPGDTIVRDTERKCKCGSKKIVYAYNMNKVNKYCENCNSFESKITKAA